MATFYPVGGGAPGIDPTILTANADDILYPKIGGVAGNYNGVQGTLQLTGNAQLNHVVAGETFYTTDAKTKLTGTMTVQSILSFSSAPYSANQIVFTWQNPYTGPFSGVIIVGKTGGYPANINDGTRYYKGFGNNVGSGATSSVTISGFSVNITYYFKAFSYSTINGEEWTSNITKISNTTISQTTLTFTSSTIWTVPSGVNFIDIFCVGGGGSGGIGESLIEVYAPDGGGGGYTQTTLNNSVIPTDELNIIVGSGSLGVSGRGGETKVTKNTTILCQAGGGYDHAEGGSGGGHGAWVNPGSEITSTAGNGGSNGSSGGFDTGENPSGIAPIGQGTTTRAFGEPTGTLYAGGGGGGAGGAMAFAGYGGAGGGGNGGSLTANATNGAPNTGGGGGAGANDPEPSKRTPGVGGSGICLIRYIS